MESKVKVINGITKSGKKGIRYEHGFKVGDKVRHRGVNELGEGVITWEGLAGCPHVEFENGESMLFSPESLEIINP